MEPILAPGCGLWDWEKGPGGGLGSGPKMAFTISEDRDRCVSQVMCGNLPGHGGTFRLSFVHLSISYLVPLGAGHCIRSRFLRFL